MRVQSITKKMLLEWGGKAVYDQAEKIVKKGLVAKCDVKGDIVSGVILRESGGEIYTKFKFFETGSIENLCPCYTNQVNGMVCPHVVALGISLMLRNTDPRREEKYQEEQRRANRIASYASTDYIQRSPRGSRATIRLLLQNSWLLDFWQERKIPVSLFFQEGHAFLLPSQLKKGDALSLSQEDDNLLYVLEDICEGPVPDRFEVSCSDFINILTISSHTVVNIGQNEYFAVQKEALPVDLSMDVDRQTGNVTLSLHPRFPNGYRPVGPVSYCVSRRQGFIFNDKYAWPMRNLLPEPYHGIYQTPIKIQRADVLTFLNRDIPLLRKLTPIKFDVAPDLFERVPATPGFHLEVAGSLASLGTKLSVQYGDITVKAGMPDPRGDITVPDPEDILRYKVRNMDEEKRGVYRLFKYGFKQEEGGITMVGHREVLNFLGSGYPELVRMGWKVSFKKSLADLIDSMQTIIPIVQIQKACKGWFDVGFTFEDPSGGRCDQAKIQQAINRRDSYLKVGEDIFLIDVNAIEGMRDIFRDCQSRPSRIPGHFLLPDVYAPFVQASLNALDGIDVEEPDDWRDDAALKNRHETTKFEPVPLGTLENTLRSYQKTGVYWLRFLESSGLNGLLADEMGLGKTLQTLCWLNLKRLSPQAQGKPSLVICPTSLVGNWAREAAKFVPEMRCLVLSGHDRKKLFSEIPNSDLVITSYALIRRDQDDYAPYTFSAAVLDEAQHIKNRNTQNAIAAKQISAINKLVLTGTPIENSVADIWSIMDFLMPEYLGDYSQFRGNYELPIAEAGIEGAAAQDKLRRKLHPFILRRIKKDVAKDLPDKIVKVSYCTLTPDQQKVYQQLLDGSRAEIGSMVKAKGFEKSRFEILALLMRLRQVCCHLDLLNDGHLPGTYKSPSSKMEVFLELLDEAIDGGHRILVFSQYVKMLTLLRGELESRKIPYCYLDGSTKDRLEQCQRFNLTPSIPIFLISLKAGGTGLNLTGADMVVHFDPWWNPAAEDQATDRAHRIGQKRTVYSIKLIAENTVEEKVLAMQRKKQAVISATIGTTDQAMMQRLSYEDIKELFDL